MFSNLESDQRANQQHLQTARTVVGLDVFEQIFEDRESFLLQMKCVMSESVEIVSY